MIQELEQVEIPSSQRSTFAGTEHSFRSFFELSHWGATIIWSRPEDFKWLALGSLGVLGIGASVFAVWSRKETRNGGIRYEEIALDDVG
jgi:iron-regulated transporter 1